MGVGSIDLLRSCSWHAERLLKSRANFSTILWLTEYADTRRELVETECNAPCDIPDAELLRDLVCEMREDFCADGVVRFAVAFLAGLKKRTESPLPEAKLTRVPVVALEVHDAFGEHWRGAREILSVNRRFILAAMGPLRPAADSVYANLLEPAVRLQAAS